jgi:hypothetical protein
MSTVSDNELSRQFKVLKQEIDMHSTLRDKYHLRSLCLDLFILMLSAILCGTTFFTKDELSLLKLEQLYPYTEMIKAFSSIFLFALSICSICVDYKQKATVHKEAASKLNQLIALYRCHYNSENDTWECENKDEMHSTYWQIHDTITPIPANIFNKLKAKYLNKVEISKMLNNYPSCPIWLLKTILFCRSTIGCIRDLFKKRVGK